MGEGKFWICLHQQICFHLCITLLRGSVLSEILRGTDRGEGGEGKYEG